MVATVGSISIDLSTNVAKFTQGFKSAATTVEQQSSRMSKAVGGIAKASKSAGGIVQGFIGGVVAGGALAAIGSLTGALGQARQALSDFEEIGNVSRVVGLTTESFQALSFGALEADVSQEKLNTSLSIFAKNAGLAEQGTGGLYSSLKKLNPELLRAILSTNDQEARLRLVSDAMAGMTSATEKAALVTAVFGKGGLEMVRVLDGGSAALDEMKRRAEGLGIIVPDDLIQRAGALDDQLEVLGKVTMVNLNQALVNLAPLLVAGAEGMASFAQGISDFAAKVDAFIASPSFATFANVINGKLIEGGFAEGMVAALTETAGGFEDLARQIKSVEGEIAETEKGIQELKDAGTDILDMQMPIKRLKELEAQLDTLREKAGHIVVDLDTSAAKAKIADLAQQFRAAENASMASIDKARSSSSGPDVNVHGGGRINTYTDPDTGVIVHGGGGGNGDAINDDIEEAIDEGTEETRHVARRTSDVYRGINDASDTISGSVEDSGHYIADRFDDGFRRYAAAAQSGPFRGGEVINSSGSIHDDLLPGKYTVAMANEIMKNKSTFGSWAGRRITIGGGGGDAYTRPLLGGGMKSAPAAIAEGGVGSTANINVVVKPVMEGQRLSTQSSAEIKQAAAAGANAALRQFHGR